MSPCVSLHLHELIMTLLALTYTCLTPLVLKSVKRTKAARSKTEAQSAKAAGFSYTRHKVLI
ncbi:hypothetical protein HanRHA438_Chr15g0698671 [Helianthus annuus]|nr:hypothetical protein HanIR_Chr15g0745891 [Helianthus annuus]KAJ0844102.1 hypothetical protein HanRHA438_Chr15g0698671 [Helianthus annuus]